MSKEVTVVQIVIKIGDVEIRLTPDEARELRGLLDDLIGDTVKEYVPYTPLYRIYPYWTCATSTDGETSIITASLSTTHAP